MTWFLHNYNIRINKIFFFPSASLNIFYFIMKQDVWTPTGVHSQCLCTGVFRFPHHTCDQLENNDKYIVMEYITNKHK